MCFHRLITQQNIGLIMKSSLLVLSALVLVACEAVSNGDTGNKNERVTYINVFKDANKKQCFSEGISLQQMETELASANINVRCSQRSNDGLMYPQACGQDEGTINVFQIASDDALRAGELGYKNVAEITSANIILECK